MNTRAVDGSYSDRTLRRHSWQCSRTSTTPAGSADIGTVSTPHRLKPPNWWCEETIAFPAEANAGTFYDPQRVTAPSSIGLGENSGCPKCRYSRCAGVELNSPGAPKSVRR